MVIGKALLNFVIYAILHTLMNIALDNINDFNIFILIMGIKLLFHNEDLEGTSTCIFQLDSSFSNCGLLCKFAYIVVWVNIKKISDQITMLMNRSATDNVPAFYYRHQSSDINWYNYIIPIYVT